MGCFSRLLTQLVLTPKVLKAPEEIQMREAEDHVKAGAITFHLQRSTDEALASSASTPTGNARELLQTSPKLKYYA